MKTIKEITARRHLRKIRKEIYRQLLLEAEDYLEELADKHFGEIIMRMVSMWERRGTKIHPGETVGMTYRITLSDESDHPDSKLTGEWSATTNVPNSLARWLQKSRLRGLSAAKLERIMGDL